MIECDRDPKAGDIIIFHPAAGALEEKQHFWEQDPVFIKRIVAVEGDVLEVCILPLLWIPPKVIYKCVCISLKLDMILLHSPDQACICASESCVCCVSCALRQSEAFVKGLSTAQAACV